MTKTDLIVEIDDILDAFYNDNYNPIEARDEIVMLLDAYTDKDNERTDEEKNTR